MSKSKPNNKHIISKEEQRAEYHTFKTVFFYCILIIVVPVLTFFVFKQWLFDGLLRLSTVTSNIYSAASAVIALHIALFLFIYKAYFTVSTEGSERVSNGHKVLLKQD